MATSSDLYCKEVIVFALSFYWESICWDAPTTGCTIPSALTKLLEPHSLPLISATLPRPLFHPLAGSMKPSSAGHKLPTLPDLRIL